MPPNPLKPLFKSSLFIFTANTRPALPSLRPLLHLQPASTTPSPPPRRRAITVVNDTGTVPWKNLSLPEKAARTTQQTFNLGLVALGILATGGVATVLYLEVFSSDSKTAVFNRAADRVRNDARCVELLAGEGAGDKRVVKAYGEPSWSRWARNRTIASRTEVDKAGTEHLRMHFYVEGPLARGTVNVHMTRERGQKEFEYRLLVLDGEGGKRVVLVDEEGGLLPRGKGGKMFGVSWHR